MQANAARFNSVMIALIATATAFPQSSASIGAKPHAKRRTAARSVLQQELDALRRQVAAQQEQLEEQRQQMDQVKSQLQQLLAAMQQANTAAQAAQSGPHPAHSAADQAQRSADQTSRSAAEAKTDASLVKAAPSDEAKQVSALQDLLGRFRVSGDVRIRGEDFFQDGAPTRNRARIRVRFGVDGKLNEDFTGGLALATGTLGDPTTTNESLTNFFDRKTIGLDRGYITYNPVAANWLSLTGGKFAFPWQRTSLTFDPDINPEGFNEKFSFDLPTPALKNLTVQGIQLLYNENSRTNDSFALGGQVLSVLKLGPLTSRASFLLLDWRFVDSLLSASAFATQSGGEGPGCATGIDLPSAPPCAFAANGMTNATYQDAGGKYHFLSGFEYADIILNNELETGARRFPLNFVLEFEENLKAANHPLNSTGAVISSLGPQNKGYLGDISLGQNRNKGDFQFGYSYWRLGQDAILASWAESDQRAPTNVLQHRMYATWRLQPRVSAQFTLWLGRTLNSNLEHAVLGTGVFPGQTEPALRRQEFDLIYLF